ncbi:MAG: SAF domain-containing protein [Myxococcaceae bacterium]|jgi:Flp pilus assembly protein CpaB|nr:SAF domain-containing protein [Myxococcaceae bacterium]MCA3011974.1 SAF domain-containing protein [Myxococcaceae bacterium]
MQARGASARAGLLVGFLVGVPLGGGGTWALRTLAQRDAADPWATVPVLVTARALPAGHTLTDADLVEATWPTALVTQSCATPATRARFVGQVARWRVAPDSVVRETDLLGREPGCAARAQRVLDAMGGGAPGAARLGAALVERHGAAP